MDISAYRDEIKLKLGADVLDLEIEDSTIDKIINSSLREMQRYISTTNIITVPYSKCINLEAYKINTISAVYRSEGFASDNKAPIDPLAASQWQLLSGTGNMYNFSDYVENYAAWNTLLQIRNTSSTDLAFYWDKPNENLYINISTSLPKYITIEYVPQYQNVEEITSDYWTDILLRLSLAYTKINLGRIRSRFTQSNALWTQDGETMLEEGNTELKELQEHLKNNTQLFYTLD